MRLQRPTPGALLAAAVLAVSLASATSQGYPCYQEGFYRDPNHCGRFYRCAPVRNRPGVFTLYTFGCPEGTAFDEYSRMCVEPHYDDPCFNQVSRGPAYAPHRPMHPFRAPVRSSFRDGQALPCRRDGFHAHPYDCNRFYRCVRYEQDSFYSIYEFNCPETLVYDEATGTCNYAEYSESECISTNGRIIAGARATLLWALRAGHRPVLVPGAVNGETLTRTWSRLRRKAAVGPKSRVRSQSITVTPKTSHRVRGVVREGTREHLNAPEKASLGTRTIATSSTGASPAALAPTSCTSSAAESR